MNGTNQFTSFEAKKLIGTYGDNNKPVYIKNGVPTTLTTIGSSTQPVYVNSGIITPISYIANRLYYSVEGDTADAASTSFGATSHYANTTQIAVNDTKKPTENLFVNGTARISLGTKTAISDASFILGGTSSNHISFGNDGLQAYDANNSETTLKVNPYGGTFEVGSSTHTTTGNYYGQHSFKTASGFVYEGIQENTNDANVNVWISNSTTTGIPTYNNQIKYNPSTGFLILDNNSTSSDGGIKSSNGKLTIESYTELDLKYASSNDIIFYKYNTEIMRLNKNGKVVIGGGDDTIIKQKDYMLYVNGESYYLGDTTHKGDILPNENNIYSLGSSEYRWQYGYFNTALNIGGTNYTDVNEAEEGTYIDIGHIKLITKSDNDSAPPSINFNYGLSNASYDSQITTGAQGQIKLNYSYSPTVTVNDVSDIGVNLYNDGTIYSTGNITTSASFLCVRESVGTIFEFFIRGVSQGKLVIDSVGNNSNSGLVTLTLGNNYSNVTGQSYGRIHLYCSNSSYGTYIRPRATVPVQGGTSPATSTSTFYLPINQSSAYATFITGTSTVGSNTSNAARPVYCTSVGKITAISTAISTAYGGTGNTSFTANRLIYTSAANQFSSTTIESDGTYLSNVTYLNINNDTNTSDNYNLYVNGTSYYGDDITVYGGKKVNFSGNNQYIQWNSSTDTIDSVGRSWYGIGQKSNKLYIANASGIEIRTDDSDITLQTDDNNINLNATAGIITLTGTNGTTLTIKNNQILFTTGVLAVAQGQDPEPNLNTALRNNNGVIPNTGETTGDIGSETNPVYVSSGLLSACTYNLNASVNEATNKNTLAYYNNKNAISAGTITTDGSYLRNIGGYTYTKTVNNKPVETYALNTASFICNDEIRTVGDHGWYNETYGGGWYMNDSTWIRSSGSKDVLIDKTLRADVKLQVGETKTGNTIAEKFYADNSGNGYFKNTLGIAGVDTNYKLYVNGSSYYIGDINFSTLTGNGTSYGIKWAVNYGTNITSNEAKIYYYVSTTTSGGVSTYNTSLVLNAGNNAIARISLRNQGSEKVYIDGSGLRPVASSKTWWKALRESPINMTDANNSSGYWPWLRQTNTNTGYWFSYGTKGKTFYWSGAPSSTEETTDKPATYHEMYYDISKGKLGGIEELYLINNNANFSYTSNALVYIENKESTHWAVRINCTDNNYGLKVEAKDATDSIVSTGDISGHCIWANQGSNGTNSTNTPNAERRVGVDSATSGKLFLYGNKSAKGLYSEGWKAGDIIKITSTEVSFNGNAATASATDALSSTGYGNSNFTFYQTNNSFAGSSGWTHYLIANYGNGFQSYNYIIGLPFSDVPKYRRLENGVANGWYKFITEENISSQSVASAGVADYLKYSNNNEINFKGGRKSSVWFNYRNADDGSTSTSTNVMYYFGNYAEGYGSVYAGKVYNAVWNDFAEFRESDISEPGRVVVSNGHGQMVLAQERLAPSAKVVTDTYGCSVGESDSAKTPLGVAGRVLVYPAQPRENYKVGDCLCAAPNGTADIMTREEIIKYPDRIIGIVDEIPTYKWWNQYQTNKEGKKLLLTNIEVKDRIWIYVR